MFIVKQHKTDDAKLLLAVIDADLKGKQITEGNKILNLDCDFFRGEEKNADEVLALARIASHLNVVGKSVIELLRKEGFVDSVMKIGSVEYAQAIIIRD